MPRKTTPLMFVGGPYHAPEHSGYLPCEIRGSVRVDGHTTTPISWPWTWSAGNRGAMCLIVCGDLARAIRTESNAAVAYYWGVSPETVRKWRRALGVARMTEGTTRRWRQLRPKKFTQARVRRGGRSSPGP